jgi:cystathionine beta-lyase
MKYDFDQVIERRDSDSEKWNHYPEDVMPMWVADMDFHSPEPVIRVLTQRIEHGIFGYPSGLSGTSKAGKEFREILVERMAERYSWEIQPEDLLFLPGVVTGLNLACHAFGQPGGKAFIQTPVYPPFLGAPHYAGLERQTMQLSGQPDGSYELGWIPTCSCCVTHTTQLDESFGRKNC